MFLRWRRLNTRGAKEISGKIVRRFISGVLLVASWATCAATTVSTTAGGKPLPGVLIIVKSLDTGHEVGRYLTDNQGQVHDIFFDQGLYRVIATIPFSKRRTVVREVFAKDVKSDFSIDMPLQKVETVDAGRKIEVRISLLSGIVQADTQFLLRTASINSEQWLTTRKDGRAEAVLTQEPTLAIVLFQRKTFAFLLSSSCVGVNPLDYDAQYCQEEKNGLVNLVLPVW